MLVYATHTGTRDITERMDDILTRHGFRVAVMPAINEYSRFSFVRPRAVLRAGGRINRGPSPRVRAGPPCRIQDTRCIPTCSEALRSIKSTRCGRLANKMAWSLPHFVSLGFFYPLRCPIFADGLQLPPGRRAPHRAVGLRRASASGGNAQACRWSEGGRDSPVYGVCLMPHHAQVVPEGS